MIRFEMGACAAESPLALRRSNDVSARFDSETVSSASVRLYRIEIDHMKSDFCRLRLMRSDMPVIRAIVFTVTFVAIALSQSGCLIAAAAAGTGAGLAYVKGKSEEVMDADPRQIAEATERA